MMRKTYFLGLTFLLSALFSCDPRRLSDENFEIENELWPKDEHVDFEVNIKDTSLHYNVFVNLRNSSEYAYSNIYLFIEMRAPSNKFFKDTVEFKLADPSGRWTGSGIGNIWQNQMPLLKDARLLEPGIYHIQISHGMREDTLKAITDVGIRVEKAYE